MMKTMMMSRMAVLTGRSGGGQMSAQLTNLFRTAQADSPSRVMIMIKMIIMITLQTIMTIIVTLLITPIILIVMINIC